MSIRSSYLHCVFTPEGLNEVVNKAARDLAPLDFDALAFTGVSGAAVGFYLAAKMNKKILCLRKTSVQAHYQGLEGDISARRIVIVDDFIQFGTTIEGLRKELRSRLPQGYVVVGIYLYRPRSGTGSADRQGKSPNWPIEDLPSLNPNAVSPSITPHLCFTNPRRTVHE